MLDFYVDKLNTIVTQIEKQSSIHHDNVNDVIENINDRATDKLAAIQRASETVHKHNTQKSRIQSCRETNEAMFDVVITTIYEFRSVLVAIDTAFVDLLPVYHDLEQPKTMEYDLRTMIHYILFELLEPILKHHENQLFKMETKIGYQSGKKHSNLPPHVLDVLNAIVEKEIIPALNNAKDENVIERILDLDGANGQPVPVIFDLIKTKVENEIEYLYREGKDLERKFLRFFVWSYQNQKATELVEDPSQPNTPAVLDELVDELDEYE